MKNELLKEMKNKFFKVQGRLVKLMTKIIFYPRNNITRTRKQKSQQTQRTWPQKDEIISNIYLKKKKKKSRQNKYLKKIEFKYLAKEKKKKFKPK